MRAIRMLAALFVALGLFACTRQELDQKLEELCRKDAGVKVYETVVLGHAEYAELKTYAGSKSREEYYGPDYRYVTRKENLIGTDNDATSGKGRLMRWSAAIYRRADGKLLGESVEYFRTGGDGLAGGSHPSSARCNPQVPGLGRSVFVEGK
jgi:hypothetical protein